MFTLESVYLLVSLLWIPSVFQTCGAFSGLRGDWSGKRAKVFPGERTGLSGDETRGALPPDPLWGTSGLPSAQSRDPSRGNQIARSQLAPAL